MAAGNLTEHECASLAASWGRDDLSVADIALIDELRILLGEVPQARRRDQSFLPGGRVIEGVRELSTVADRQFASRERAPRPDNYDGYAHVLVDEAQDVSPMQWRMLGRRGEYASWTIVGDAAQSAWPDLREARRGPRRRLAGQAVAPFPPGHELPQLGGDLRVRGRRGTPGRARRGSAGGRAAHRHLARAPAGPARRPGARRWRRPSPSCSPTWRARSA